MNIKPKSVNLKAITGVLYTRFDKPVSLETSYDVISSKYSGIKFSLNFVSYLG